jgi:hypothetical protein
MKTPPWGQRPQAVGSMGAFFYVYTMTIIENLLRFS